jgi:hypothetical protein
MKNIFEQAKLIEDVKNGKFAPSAHNDTLHLLNKKKEETPKFVYSDNMKETFKKFKPDIAEEKQDKPRAERTIGKESQRRGKGRGCM